MSVSQAFKDHPRKWDYGIMLSLVIALLTAGSYIIGNEVGVHNIDTHAHPAMSQQLIRVEANQIRNQIIQMDVALCEDSQNAVYRSELSRLISEWEKITGKIFPRELLRCA